MKIFFGDRAVFDTDEHRLSLMRAFLRIGVGQHQAVVADVEHLLNSVFFRSLAPIEQTEWRELVERTAGLPDRATEPGSPPVDRHARVDEVRARRDEVTRFPLSPSEVGEFAETPLKLLLENRRDWGLLQEAARVFEVEEIETAFANRWLELDHCGGCGEVLNRVRRRNFRERWYVFVDQDPLQPQTIQQIKASCGADPKIGFWITLKHEIENYIPEPIFDFLILGKRKLPKNPQPNSQSARLIEWKKLANRDKDLDDIKKRFGKSTAEKALNRLNTAGAFTNEQFIERSGTELQEMLGELKAWL